MKTRIATRDVIVHGIAPGALLLDTDEHGNESPRRVRSVDRHPARLDHVILMGDDGSGQTVVKHLSDWVRRVIEL